MHLTRQMVLLLPHIVVMVLESLHGGLDGDQIMPSKWVEFCCVIKTSIGI